MNVATVSSHFRPVANRGDVGEPKPPAPPDPPHDDVSLGERLGNAMLRGARASLPALAAGSVGALAGTCVFGALLTRGMGANASGMLRGALLMTTFWPAASALCGLAGGAAGTFVEVADGTGPRPSQQKVGLTAAAVVGGLASFAMHYHIWDSGFH